MSYTVADLTKDPHLGTVNLTPGVGELRPLTWAHVCELKDPWNWLGDGALIMTTGLAIPKDADEQVAYVEQSHAAGIASVAISEGMSAPPLSNEMLTRAEELGFPILSTALDIPFVALAKAVTQANFRQQQQRLTTAQRVYEALTRHLTKANLPALLDELGILLHGTFRVISTTEAAAPGDEAWRILMRIPTTPDLSLEFTSHGARIPDRSLLQYANAAVTGLIAIRQASRRRDAAQGAFLLSRLIDGRIDEDTAAELLDPHEIPSPYRVVAWRLNHAESRAESISHALAEHGLKHLYTVRETLIVFLVHGSPDNLASLEAMSDARKVGASAGFTQLREVRAAYRQTRAALDFPSMSRLNLYEDLHEFSPFLGAREEVLESAARGLLQPLIDNDAEKGTYLLLTLRVFLEENRNWKHTAARLHVHRQTLYARIARIEQLTGRDLSTVPAMSDFWLALQTASSLGLLDDIPTHTHI